MFDLACDRLRVGRDAVLLGAFSSVPLLRFAGGWLVGIMLFGLGSIVIGISPSDATVNLLGIAIGFVCGMTPATRSAGRDEKANAAGPAV